MNNINLNFNLNKQQSIYSPFHLRTQFFRFYYFISFFSSLLLFSASLIFTSGSLLQESNFVLGFLFLGHWLMLPRVQTFYMLTYNHHIQILLFQMMTYVFLAFKEGEVVMFWQAFLPGAALLYLSTLNDHSMLYKKMSSQHLIDQIEAIGFVLFPLIAGHAAFLNLSFKWGSLSGFYAGFNFYSLLILSLSLASLYMAGLMKQLHFQESLKFEAKKHSFSLSTEFGEGHHKDKMFFHDLMNQCHAIDLFLNQKLLKNETLAPDDYKSLKCEVEAIKKTTQDHFQFYHKNVSTQHEYVPFDLAMEFVDNLLKTYFPKDSQSPILEFCIHPLDGDDSQTLIHFSIFSRIINNLVKNLKESQSEFIKLDFYNSKEGLKIFIRNKLSLSGHNEQSNFLKKLNQKISKTAYLNSFENVDENFQTDSLGLDSISEQVSRVHGTFSFSTEQGDWITEVYLPHPEFAEVLNLKKAS